MSERYRERLLFSSLSCLWVLPFFIGLLAISRSASPWVRYALLTGVNGEPYSESETCPCRFPRLTHALAHAILVGLISRNSNNVAIRAVSAAVYNMCYQLGSIVAVNVYREEDRPYCTSAPCIPRLCVRELTHHYRLSRQPDPDRHHLCQHCCFCCSQVLLHQAQSTKGPRMESHECRREISVSFYNSGYGREEEGFPIRTLGA